MTPNADPRPARASPTLPRAVAFRRVNAGSAAGDHDNLTKADVARSIAALLRVDFLGDLTDAGEPPAGTLWVPSDTLLVDDAARLGIRDAADLFGGVVPHAFVATKVITHALVGAQAARPANWNAAFGEAVRDAVLPGYSAFSEVDALLAGTRLLPLGAVRIKQADGVGGAGQTVARSALELRAQLDALPRESIESHGLVLELNLEQLTTYSVGQVRIGPWLATYVGTQSATPNFRGDEVYGGSDLKLARGDYEQLLALALDEGERACVEQALVYHRQAIASFPGLLATRCNYDVVRGTDAAGTVRAGVLEQSWRIGGASGAEIAGLIALRDDPSLIAVRAGTHERYSRDVLVPEGGIVHYDGLDAHGGPLVKYALVGRYVDA